MTERFTLFTMQISRLYKLIQKLKAEGMGKFGLKGVDTLCLYRLSERGAMSFAEIAESCQLDPALVSRTLGALVKGGMVVRAGSPGKYHAVYSLSDVGRERTRVITGMIDCVQTAVDGGISEEELQVFYRVLAKLTDNFVYVAENAKTIFQCTEQEETIL